MEPNERHGRGKQEEAAEQYGFQDQGVASFNQWYAMPGVEQNQNPPSWDYGGTMTWWASSGTQQAFPSYGTLQTPSGAGWPEPQFLQGNFGLQNGPYGGYIPTPLPDAQEPNATPVPPDHGFNYIFSTPPLGQSPAATEEYEQASPETQRGRQRIPPQAKAVLQKWFDDHREDPYVDKEEVLNLSKATGLTGRQVRTFFANARARKLSMYHSTPSRDSATSGGEEGSPSKKEKANVRRGKQPVPVTIQTLSAMSTQAPSPVEQDPMERYLSSSPEEEGFSEDILLQHPAASISPSHTSSHKLSRHVHAEEQHSEAAFSSHSGSNSSHASLDSAANYAPRRGRKRHRVFSFHGGGPSTGGASSSGSSSNISVARPRADPHRIYQCTFCVRDFAQKYDWRRHEESVHLPQKEWVCMPDGPATRSPCPSSTTTTTTTSAVTNDVHCVFCNAPNPSAAHLATHNVAPCLAAPLSARTFTRKDKLIQHLGQVHRHAPAAAANVGAWCRRVERGAPLVLACGFCGLAPLRDWPARVEHVAAHFAEGLDMALWVGGPGGVAFKAGVATESRVPVLGPPPLLQYRCALCSAVFATGADAVFHERLAHRVWRARPQAGEGAAREALPASGMVLGRGGGGR
ncbi:uncharacterized protein K452DRAFT_282335 [Aplosporella prunicola CBS 121167]|uniref:Homeobox domain-containing protein n=1 Tax=Aplosporella prunicola CBS 121167 TaxID=1176127 RepID=A0A6A6BU34_9PEZI|nr:uncharacterized protein K452DRAFT_282335 [Aplosporella prunicola CBS 121167]KAF2147328.1 hypothetical protein K452DRAFT_282335 [Aplosporella prunicola CBS 121167]